MTNPLNAVARRWEEKGNISPENIFNFSQKTRKLEENSMNTFFGTFPPPQTCRRHLPEPDSRWKQTRTEREKIETRNNFRVEHPSALNHKSSWKLAGFCRTHSLSLDKRIENSIFLLCLPTFLPAIFFLYIFPFCNFKEIFFLRFGGLLLEGGVDIIAILNRRRTRNLFSVMEPKACN